GTTCKMAKINNRQFIGIDISPEYCKIAKERLDVVEYEEFQKQLFKVKGMTSEEDLIL
ncbi:MAG: DNA methyltransferase, partial [Candidatus Pacebacteria bacterium]|nr:DNA methyltransferase [Candidatus Paceibacterota bacterium]